MMKQGLSIMIGIILFSAVISSHIYVVGAPAPISNESAQVQPGETALSITLPNMQGTSTTIGFKGKPTVMVSLHELRINKLADFQKFYDKYKQSVNFYIVCHSDKEIVQQLLDNYRFTMPVLLDNQKEYVNRFNKVLPSMLIVDGNGIVRYNGTSFVEEQSLDRYTDELIANKLTSLPVIMLDPPNYVQQAPPSMRIGDVVTDEHLYDSDGNYIAIKYTGKPTVLLFWAGFNSVQALERTLPVIQAVYQSRGSDANFYTVSFSSSPEQAQKVLNSYNVTVPSLFDKYPTVNLKYTYSCPAFVIIDQNGVMRYRPVKSINVEQLETIIDSLNSPNDTVLSEKVQHLNDNNVEVYQSVPLAYQNDDFQCKMTLPIGWSNTNWTNKEAIFLYKSIPVMDEKGEKMAAIMEIRSQNLNSSFQTLNDLPSERLEAIKTNFINFTRGNIREKNNVAVEGNIKDIGKHKVIWVVSSGKARVIDATLLENGVMWNFHVAIPLDYFSTMTTELEQIIESFTMI